MIRHSSRLIAFLFAGMTAAAVASAAGQVSIADFLRDQGFVPAAKIPYDQGAPAFVIVGTPDKPSLSETVCMPDYEIRTQWEGKRFSYRAHNRGEWGGTFSVREGRKPERALISENVVFVDPSGNELYVFTGVDHLGADDGSVHVIDDFDSRPRARLITQLPGTPRIVQYEDAWRGYVVITRQSISVMRPSPERLELLMANHGPLHDANSLLTFGRADMLIGVCGGLAHVHFPWRVQQPADGWDQVPVLRYWVRQ